MKNVIMILAVTMSMSLISACSDTRETVKADPTSDKYEPLHDKGTPGYSNNPGSQNREVREDIRHDRKIKIKED